MVELFCESDSMCGEICFVVVVRCNEFDLLCQALLLAELCSAVLILRSVPKDFLRVVSRMVLGFEGDERLGGLGELEEEDQLELEDVDVEVELLEFQSAEVML